MKALGRMFRRNPYPLYSVMRRVSPVFHDRLHGLWLLFDFASVKRALEDHASFSSRAAPPGGDPLDWLIFRDPPQHTRLRGLIMKTFTPRSISALEPRIRTASRALLDRVVGRGEMDLVNDYAALLPVTIIAEMIGIPIVDHARFKRWTEAILGLSDTVVGGAVAARALQQYRQAKAEMRPYILDLAAQRRASPAEDLLTRLVEAEIDGTRLQDDEIFDFAQLLMLAGSETTTSLIANAILCFDAFPDELVRVRETPALLPAAVEEVVRLRTPTQLVFRATAREVRLHGRVIPPGQLVLPMIGSANRDPRQFRDPDRFNVRREGNPHVGFGHGIHYCIGAALARLEARVALEHLFEALPDLRLAGSRSRDPRSAFSVHGPSRLPVRFRATRAIP